jgi:hypothetical protein
MSQRLEGWSGQVKSQTILATQPAPTRYLGVGTIILPFSVSYATSEDPTHHAENLALAFSTDGLARTALAGKGWQSRKFCEYP